MVGAVREDREFRCPVHGETFRREVVTWEDAETGQYACPVCGGLHDVPPEDVPPTMPPPPAVAVTGVRPFSLRALTFATLMGSSIAGGVLMSVNYRRMGRPRAAWHALIWITLGTLFTLVPPFLLPVDEPGFPVAIGLPD